MSYQPYLWQSPALMKLQLAAQRAEIERQLAIQQLLAEALVAQKELKREPGSRRRPLLFWLPFRTIRGGAVGRVPTAT